MTKTKKWMNNNLFILDKMMDIIWDEELQYFDLNNTPNHTTFKINLYLRTGAEIYTLQKRIEKLGITHKDICQLHILYNDFDKSMLVTIAT